MARPAPPVNGNRREHGVRRVGADGVSMVECEAAHRGVPASALSKALRGPSQPAGWTDENATAGFLVVQVRGLGTVPGNIPQASARLTSRHRNDLGRRRLARFLPLQTFNP